MLHLNKAHFILNKYVVFSPKQKSPGDVSYFDTDFTMEKAKLTKIDKDLLSTIDPNMFKGFSFTSPSMVN